MDPSLWRVMLRYNILQVPMTSPLYDAIYFYIPRHITQNYYKKTHILVQYYVVYTEFSWILQACLLIRFTLYILSVCFTLTSPFFCLILTLWISDSKPTYVGHHYTFN